MKEDRKSFLGYGFGYLTLLQLMGGLSLLGLLLTWVCMHFFG